MWMNTLAATLLLALPAVGAEPQLPALRIEPKSGGSILYVKNVSQKPLTAFLIELVDYPGSSYALWQDEIGADPIAPGREKKIEIQNMTVGAVPDYVKLQAAIYADGSTAGIPERVTKLVERRRASLQTVRDLLHRLEMATTAKTSKEHVSAILKQAAEFMALKPDVDKMSQHAIDLAVGKSLFVDTADYLDTHSLDETIASLQAKENALKGSKPAL